MGFALKLHGVAMIALVLCVSIGIDLALAYRMGTTGSSAIVELHGVGFNGAQLALCLLALTMSIWKSLAALHIREAIRRGHQGAALAASILLACSIAVSAAVELSWFEGILAIEAPAGLHQLGENLSARFGGDATVYAYVLAAVVITFLQLGAATLPLIVFGGAPVATSTVEGTDTSPTAASPALQLHKSGRSISAGSPASAVIVTYPAINTPVAAPAIARSRCVPRKPNLAAASARVGRLRLRGQAFAVSGGAKMYAQCSGEAAGSLARSDLGDRTHLCLHRSSRRRAWQARSPPWRLHFVPLTALFLHTPTIA